MKLTVLGNTGPYPQAGGACSGYLLENGPADLVIFDPNADREVSANFASKASNSPFIGDQLKGQVKYTICQGKLVYQAD